MGRINQLIAVATTRQTVSHRLVSAIRQRANPHTAIPAAAATVSAAIVSIYPCRTREYNRVLADAQAMTRDAVTFQTPIKKTRMATR
ncbi:MAG: PE domain-containing protein [Fuerstiella sp.]|nr:PE domain-containing protein [Fuerstiella sp.]MCP4504993.1 PE domain-containing protein [Fuerstiella sp.]